ncbi:MAG: pantoate--beta-alanine ligase, partial [Rickettsiales bacterium]
NTIETLQQSLLELAQDGKRVALVPTMGALHAGHASLITQALEIADVVVVSIFVNPTQFAPTEDFSKYPRTLEADIAVAEAAGAEIIYTPTVEDMYPEGFSTNISAGKISTLLCGKSRVGHFDAVATIVTKLLLRIMPHIAVFGAKDYQQLCIIDQVVEDLDIPVEIIGMHTVREADGLALSSRNRYLSKEERKIAPLLYQTLTQVAEALKHSNVSDSLAKGIADLTAQGYKVEYLELCNCETLEPLTELEDDAMLLVAARLGETRLIDNIVVE